MSPTTIRFAKRIRRRWQIGKWAAVVPSNRPERLAQFRKQWDYLFSKHDVALYVVEDEEPWAGIPDFIPRRTDMIRSYGFYQAWRDGAEFILSLDDDVAPIEDPIAEYEYQFSRDHPCSPYLSVGSLTSSRREMRGFPYRQRRRPVAAQWGAWEGILDYDAATQIEGIPDEATFAELCIPVPHGAAVTTCAMNFAFRAEHTPLMWQLPMLEGRYNRFGDIWGGLLAKKAIDALGEVVLVNGHAKVRHDRASDPRVNLLKEAPGVGPNEDIWGALSGDTYREITNSAVRYFRDVDPEYAEHFLRCRDEWLSLFEEGSRRGSSQRAGRLATASPS